MKGLTLIVPLVTYPYLIKVLGSEKYGLIMWAWSIVNFFIIFINFGFDLSVTKYISINKGNKTKISEIVFTTLAAKTILFFISLIIFLFLINFTPNIKENKKLFLYTYCLAIGETIMPIWFFQGIEQMKYTAIITSFVKIGFTILVFLLIKKSNDYLKVPLLYALSSIISALFAYYLILFKYRIKFLFPKLSNILFYFKDSFALFLSSSISIVKESVTIIFIEKYIGLSFVAYFDIAQKFVNILLTPFHILSTVIFPYMSKAKNFVLLKKVIVFSTIISIIIYILIFIFSKNIVFFLVGNINTLVENILRILAFSIIFANIASLLGTNGLVVIGKNKKLFLSSLYGILVYFFILIIISNFFHITIELVTIFVVISYFIDMLFRIYYLKR